MSKIREWINKIPKKVYVILGAAIALLLTLIIVISMLPVNVSNRALKKGNLFLVQGEYEKADAMFTKAITKNKYSIDAYIGKIVANSQNDIEASKETLLAAVDITTEALEKEKVDKASFVELFLYVPELIKDDLVEQNTLLKFGYESLDYAPDLLNPLYDSYVAIADGIVIANPYDALLAYETALELGVEEPLIYGKIANASMLLINQYIESDDYDKATDTLNKYGAEYGLDVSSIQDRIATSKDLYDTKIALLSKVYPAMENYYELVGKNYSEESIKNAENVLCGMMSIGWVDMMELDGSLEAEKLANSMTQTAYVYAPAGFTKDYSGMGCGLYTYGEPSVDEEGNNHTKYYFYFGNYKNGVRSGYGFSFAKSKEGSYRGFEGNWENDAPEGFGVEYISNYVSKNSPVEYQSVVFGNFTKGIENGTMTALIRLTDAAEEMFKGTYEAENGVAPSVPTVTEDYELLTQVPEDQVVIAVIPSINKGYDIYNVLYKKKDAKLSALGF